MFVAATHLHPCLTFAGEAMSLHLVTGGRIHRVHLVNIRPRVDMLAVTDALAYSSNYRRNKFYNTVPRFAE